MAESVTENFVRVASAPPGCEQLVAAPPGGVEGGGRAVAAAVVRRGVELGLDFGLHRGSSSVYAYAIEASACLVLPRRRDAGEGIFGFLWPYSPSL